MMRVIKTIGAAVLGGIVTLVLMIVFCNVVADIPGIQTWQGISALAGIFSVGSGVAIAIDRAFRRG